MLHIRRFRSGALLAVLALGLLSAPACPEDVAAYRRSVEQWRAERLKLVTSDEGYLTYAALIWLREGRNTFGSAPDNNAVLPSPMPPHGGYLDLYGDKITVHVNSGVPITMAGKPVETAELQPDEMESRMFLGDLTFYVHHTGTRYALRLKDKNNKLRKEFTGQRWYPIDPAYRVRARFVPYPSEREVDVETLLGDRDKLPMAGYVQFVFQGKQYKLEAVQGDNKELLMIFRDLTSKTTTYAVRFLPTDPVAPDNTVVVDFNKAYNPPCAFNPYMTCPLPTPGNRLPVAIPAGEQRYH
ncbi:MAG TPA: DUF1684 domain-containing protein [Candidatus Angelobacter sp.]|jgi:hypothetical protein